MIHGGIEPYFTSLKKVWFRRRCGSKEKSTVVPKSFLPEVLGIKLISIDRQQLISTIKRYA